MDMALPALFIWFMPAPAWSCPFYFRKLPEGESHAMFMIKRSAWPQLSIIDVIDVIPHMPDPAWSILGNRRKVILTRRSSSNEALTTIIYYWCYDSHAQSCLVYFRKPEEGASHAMFIIKRSVDHKHLLFMLWLTCPILPGQSPIYFRKLEEDESYATSFDVPHQRVRGVMPEHVVPIFRYVRASSWVKC